MFHVVRICTMLLKIYIVKLPDCGEKFHVLQMTELTITRIFKPFRIYNMKEMPSIHTTKTII